MILLSDILSCWRGVEFHRRLRHIISLSFSTTQDSSGFNPAKRRSIQQFHHHRWHEQYCVLSIVRAYNFLWERIIAMTKGFGFGLIIRRIIGIKGCKQNCVSVIAGMEFAF